MSEKAEWRECEFGSKPFATSNRRVRVLHYDYQQWERYRRRCKWRGEVAHSDCAQCPVPALVAAVRAARSHIDSGPYSGKPVEVDSIELDEKIDAALALLPKGE